MVRWLAATLCGLPIAARGNNSLGLQHTSEGHRFFLVWPHYYLRVVKTPCMAMLGCGYQHHWTLHVVSENERYRVSKKSRGGEERKHSKTGKRWKPVLLHNLHTIGPAFGRFIYVSIMAIPPVCLIIQFIPPLLGFHNSFMCALTCQAQTWAVCHSA